MTAPAIILVRPQMGENIGAVARAMMNFGLRELRIVAPRDGWPNPAAEAMAAHGLEIIQNATLYDTTRDALYDLHYVYASTARDRRVRKPQLTPRESVADMHIRAGEGQKVGLLFGPERTGLENEDIALSQAIVTVPTDPNHWSLNLAQCAVVMAYEWFSQLGGQENAVVSSEGEHSSAHASAPNSDSIPASQKDLNAFFDHLEASLDKTYFFKLDAKKPRMWRNLRATLQRAELSEQEVHTLYGMVVALEKGAKKG
jgi:tRNA/rRNA methyltransferase